MQYIRGHPASVGNRIGSLHKPPQPHPGVERGRCHPTPRQHRPPIAGVRRYTLPCISMRPFHPSGRSGGSERGCGEPPAAHTQPNSAWPTPPHSPGQAPRKMMRCCAAPAVVAARVGVAGGATAHAAPIGGTDVLSLAVPHPQPRRIRKKPTVPSGPPASCGRSWRHDSA